MIVSWPSSAQAVLGWTEAQALEQRFLALLQPDVSFGKAGTDNGAFEGFTVRTAVTCSDRTRLPVELLFIPDHAGDSAHVTVAIRAADAGSRDASELPANTAPGQRETAADEFLARMSHEIRTPMNGVLGMLELIQATELSDLQKRYADAMNRSALALLQIINGILDFSKIEAGKLELLAAPFSVQELLDDVNELFAEEARKKGLELLNVRRTDVPRQLIGDAFRLRQVLVNLVGNAIKFTDAGEVVTSVELADEQDDSLAVRFKVRDTGAGIPAELHDRIFSAFVQTDESATRRHGGTGLGLAICRQLVELMDGEISVSSEPGVGSTFSFTARLKQQQHSGATTTTGLRVLDSRVIIVDDNAPSRRILSLKLHSWGMQVTVARDGKEAWSLIQEAATAGQGFDVAILDLRMPGMDGLALARRIKQDSQLEHTRLLMLSGVRDENSTVWREAGIDSYLTKPARLNDIRDALVQLVDTTRSSDDESESPDAKLDARILVVEDNEVNQEVARGMLAVLGCEVDVAANGRLALEATAENDYDLILMDCHMPELDGFEATRELRRRETHSGRSVLTPIVALTANARQDDSKACKAAGMDGFLSKPFTVEQLRNALSEWLPNRVGTT